MGFRTGRFGKQYIKRTKSGYRSKGEETLAKGLSDSKISFEYEPDDKKLSYILEKKYLPDFIINGFIVEYKGYFPPEDRTKMLAVKDNNPEIDIRFIFENSLQKLSSTKSRFPITYGDWCVHHGFDYICLKEEGFEGVLKILKKWIRS